MLTFGGLFLVCKKYSFHHMIKVFKINITKMWQKLCTLTNKQIKMNL